MNAIEAAKSAVPLKRISILLTRPGNRAEKQQKRLMALGADVTVLPMTRLELNKGTSPADLVHYLQNRPEQNKNLILTSPSAVNFFFSNYPTDLFPVNIRIAVCGKTSQECLSHHLHDKAVKVLVSEGETAESLAENLIRDIGSNPAGSYCLHPASSLSRETLRIRLSAAGIAYKSVTLYYNTPIRYTPEEMHRALCHDCIVFHSPSSVSAFAANIDAKMLRASLHRPPLVAIGPVTATQMHEKGMPPAAIAVSADTEDLARAIRRALDINNQ